MRVLVVEDEKMLADAVAEGLRQEAFAVDVVHDGAAALERLGVNDYDVVVVVVVLDRDLPAVHGDEVCHRIVADGMDVRVLMLTVSTTVAERVAGLTLGADDYLPKPFAFAELVARIRALGRRSRPRPPCGPVPQGVRRAAGTMIMVRNSTEYTLSIAFPNHPTKDPYGGLTYDDQYQADLETQRVILDSMQQNVVAKVGLTVLVVWLAATVAGWFVAGRLLRPLSTITATAQRLASRTLHRRIALESRAGEVKTLADSFDRMLDRLDEAFAGQGRFIANAAHELKTSLALNRTLVEVAMKRAGSPPEMQVLGDNLLAVNQRHERLIDALLTLARADEAGAERYGLDLADLATAAVETTSPLAEEHRVRVD